MKIIFSRILISAGKKIVKRQIVLPSQEEYERRKYYGKKFCLRNDTRITRRRDSRD